MAFTLFVKVYLKKAPVNQGSLFENYFFGKSCLY